MDPGTALAVVSLAFQAFGACVEGFVILSEAHNHGKDAMLLKTMINFEEYRLISWSKKVGLLSDPPSIDPRINSHHAKALLQQLHLLLNLSNLKSRYKLDLVDKDEPLQLPTTPISHEANIIDSILSVEEKRDVLFRARLLKHANAWPKRLWWAAVDKKRFEALVGDARTLIDGLWALLSDVQQLENLETMRQLLAATVQISQDVNELRNLKIVLESHASATVPQTLIGAAAGLRATKLQLGPDPESSTNLASSPGLLVEEVSKLAISNEDRRQVVPADLSASLFRDFRPLEDSGVIGAPVGIATYDGELVYVETKPATPRDKGLLRHRVEDVAAMLREEQPQEFFALRTRGFFEDDLGFKIIYHHPRCKETLKVVGQAGVPNNTWGMPKNLFDLMSDKKLLPTLESRLSLAVKLCQTFLTFHVAGWSHKGLRCDNVLFFPTAGDDGVSLDEGILHAPYLAGFNYARLASPREYSEAIPGMASTFLELYQHPVYLGGMSRFEWYMDLYALGILLIEISEWWPLKKIAGEAYDAKNPDLSTMAKNVRALLIRRFISRPRIAFHMGRPYARLVEICLLSDEKKDLEQEVLQQFHQAFIALERVQVGN